MSKETSGDDTSSISSLSSTDSDRVKNILSRWRRPSGPRITTESAASKFLALRKPKAKASPNKGDNSSSSADSLSAQSDSDGTQSRPLSQSQSPPAKKDDKNAATDAATEEKKRAAEEAEKKRAAEEAEKMKRLADEEAAKQAAAAAEAEKTRLADEEAAQQAAAAAEVEKKRVADEEAAKQAAAAAAAEAERQRVADEEAAQKAAAAAEAEIKGLADEEAAQQAASAAEAEKKRLADEEAAQQAASAAEAEKKRLADEEAAQQAASAAEAEKKRVADEEAAQKATAAEAEKERVADEEAAKQAAAAAAAEAETQATAAAETEKQAAAAAEAEKQRLPADEADKQRLAAGEAEKQRSAADEAAKKAVAAAEAEKQRLAAGADEGAGAKKAVADAEQAEKERLAGEKAEKERLADESEAANQKSQAEAEAEAEKQRLAAQEAEKQRFATEKAATEEAEQKRLAEGVELARKKQVDQAEKERLAASEAEQAEKKRLEEQQQALAGEEQHRLEEEKEKQEAEEKRLVADKAELGNASEEKNKKRQDELAAAEQERQRIAEGQELAVAAAAATPAATSTVVEKKQGPAEPAESGESKQELDQWLTELGDDASAAAVKMQAKQRQKQARKEVDSRRAAKARPPFPPPPKTEAEIEQEELNQWLEEIDTNEASKAALKMQNKQRQKLAKKEVNKRKEAMQKRVAEKAKADQERAEARAKEQAELDEWMKGLGDDANAAALKMQSKQRQREARRQVSRKREEENRVNFGDVDFILEDAEGDVGTTRARLSSDSYPHPSKAHPIFKAEDFHVAPDGSRRNLRARKESEPDLRNFAIMHADLKRDQSQDLRVAQEFERLQYADARRGKGQLLGSGPYVKRQLPEHKDTGGASNQAAEGEALLPFFQKPLGNTRGVAATSVMMIDSSTAATVPMSEFDDDGMEPTFRRSPKLAKVEEEPPSSSSMHQKQNGGLTLSSGDGSMRSIMLATGPIGMSAQDYINNDDEARLNNRIVVPGAVPSAPAPADAESLFVRTPGPSGIFLIDQVGAKQSRFALAGVGKDVKDRPALPQYVSRRSTHRGEPRSSPFKQTGKQAMSSPTSSSYRKHGNKGTGKHAADSPQRTTTGGAPGGSSSSSRSSVTIGAPSPSSGAAPVILDAPPSSSSTGAEDSGAVELQKRMEAVSRIPRLSTPFEVNTKSILGDPVVKKIMLEQEKKLKIQEEVFRRLNFVARKDDDDKLVLAERLKYYGVPGAPSRLMADGSWMPDPDEGLGLTTRRWPMDFAYSSKQQREAEMTQKWIDEEMRRTGKSEEQVQAEILEAASDRDKKRSPKNRGSSLSPRGVTKVIKAYGGGVMGEREMKRGLNPEPPRILEASPEHVEISPLVFGQSTDLNTKERVTPGSPRNHVAQVTREQKRKAARMKAIREIQAYTLEPAAASSLPVEDSRKRNQSMAARGEAVMSSMEPPRGGGRPIEGPLGWNLSSRALKIETGAPTQHQGIGSASNASSSPAHSQATHGKASSGSASREQWYDRHHIIPAKDNFEKQSLYRDYFSRPQETMDNIRTGHTSADYYDTLLQQERNNWKYKK